MRLRLVLLMLCVTLAPAAGWACDQCGCAINTRRAASGTMIVTPTASTLGKGRLSMGFLFERQRFNAIPAGDAHELHHDGHEAHGKNHEEFYNLSLGYGVAEDLDLYLTAPLVSKHSIEIERHSALGQKTTAAGFGDLRLAAKYRLPARAASLRRSRSFAAALLLAVKAPTGETDELGAGGLKLGPELQPGSGSWDFSAGAAVSGSATAHLAWAGAFRYTARGEGAKDETLGDLFLLNAGVSYALKPLGRHPNLSLVLELHNEWALRDHSREQDRVWDSGGTTLLLSPGISADLTETLSAYWAMPIPIYQNLGGQHEELTYEIIAGLTLHF